MSDELNLKEAVPVVKKTRGRKKKDEDVSKINGLIDVDGFMRAAAEIEKDSLVTANDVVNLLIESMEQAYLEWSYPGLFKDKDSKDPDLEAVKNLVQAKVVFSENFGKFEIYDIKTVTEEDEIIDDSYQISLEDAQEIVPSAKLGDVIDIPFDVTLLDKPFVRRVKQLLTTKFKDASKSAILSLYKDKIGHLIEGSVVKVDEENKTYELSFGKANGILKKPNLIPQDNFSTGERVTVYLKEVSEKQSPASLIITRSSELFVKALMEDSIPELTTGEVKVKAISREAGRRTKVFVESTVPNLDPVGACVGPESTRIHNVLTNLRGEKIDILVYKKNKALQIIEAMKPATVIGISCPEDFFDENVSYQELEREPNYEYPKITVVVMNGNQGVAIGSLGVNVRLASKITMCTISVLQADEAIKQGLKYMLVQDVEKLAGETVTSKPEAKPLTDEEKQIQAEAEAEVAEELHENDNVSEEKATVTEEKKVEEKPVEDEKPAETVAEEKPAVEEKPVEKPTVEEKPVEVIEHVEIKNKPKVSLEEIEEALSSKKGPSETRSRKRFNKPKADEEKKEDEPSLASQQEAMPIYTQEELEQMDNDEQEPDYEDDTDIDLEDYEDDKYYNN